MMRVTITLKIVHERESPGDASATLLIPALGRVHVTGGGESRIETRIEPPEALTRPVRDYAAYLAGRLDWMLRQAPAPAAEATLTVALEVN